MSLPVLTADDKWIACGVLMVAAGDSHEAIHAAETPSAREIAIESERSLLAVLAHLGGKAPIAISHCEKCEGRG